MADEYKWLDRETAERLLRGEPPYEAVDSNARDQAERLARTLSTLSALPARTMPATETDEVAGEAAALAAFRAARAGRVGEPSAVRVADGSPADAGLVRIGGREHGGALRRRWGRSARFGLAAALVAGMVGGVAAAGTGVLPGPFGEEEPGPDASISAAATPQPDRPPTTPSPDAGPATPGGALGGASGQDSTRGTGDDDPAGGDDRDTAASRAAASACRALRAGKTLDGERRRRLEGLAGGSSRVTSYCAVVLENSKGTKDGKDGKDGKNGKDQDSSGPDARDSRTGGQNGQKNGKSRRSQKPGRSGRSASHGQGQNDGSSRRTSGGDNHRTDGAIGTEFFPTAPSDLRFFTS